LLNVTMPTKVDFDSAVRFCLELQDLPDSEHYVFDFSGSSWFEPFGMLLTARAISHFRATRPTDRFSISNHEANTYPYHVGFYQSISPKLTVGNKPGEAPGSSDYIPLTCIPLAEVRATATLAKTSIDKVLEQRADPLAQVLARSNDKLTAEFRFAVTELMRNILEHSEADSIWVAGQYWSRINVVELAILDEGIGIRRGIANNPFLRARTDADALLFAIEPGISGKAYAGSEHAPDENQGFGLYLASGLCGETGSFGIVSRTNALEVRQNTGYIHESAFAGTAIRLRMSADLENLLKLRDRLVRAGDTVSNGLRRLMISAGRLQKPLSSGEVSRLESCHYVPRERQLG
jgi:hypothetical protein